MAVLFKEGPPIAQPPEAMYTDADAYAGHAFNPVIEVLASIRRGFDIEAEDALRTGIHDRPEIPGFMVIQSNGEVVTSGLLTRPNVVAAQERLTPGASAGEVSSPIPIVGVVFDPSALNDRLA